ncbi:MAG TPA: NAD(P)/FAD-dependent oxidoreductase [Actinomycetota bacterium]|nr:NAD(P)/FAD-dependent oxidoreductase [Actinomycetota bacterium]
MPTTPADTGRARPGPARVCVVGAGFAGLAAAVALADGGLEPLVLEARDRVGGRVHSRRLHNGAVVELGAEFVEDDHGTLVATARALGLAMAPTGMAYGDRDPRGGLGSDRATVLAEAARLGGLLAGRPGPELLARSVAEVLDGLPLDPGAREAIAARLQVSAAQPVEALSAAALGHAGSSFSTRESLRVAGGNQRLALALAARLPGAVHLATPVRAVAWSPSGVRVATDGAELAAEACLLAVPASVMGEIAFDPPLPSWKADALARVAYGHAAKLFVPLRQLPPPSAVLSVPGHYWTWTADGADGTVQPVVSAFAGSAPALAALEVSSGPATWRRELAALRPDLDLDDGELLSTWDDDPWVRAAYSTRTPAFRPGDPDLLARPVGPLHFAGEHTAGPWSGLMEGALRSGHRAAGELLRIP